MASNVVEVSVGEAMSAVLGQEGKEEVLGAWLAEMHRDRPRLMLGKHEGRAKAPHYLAFVRQQPCAACGRPGPNDADHNGPRGVGQKADDYRTIPLCRPCHSAKHHGFEPKVDANKAMVETLVRYLRIVEDR